MSNVDSSNFDFLITPDGKIPVLRNPTDSPHSVVRQTPAASGGVPYLTPWTHTPAPQRDAERLARNGLKLMVSCGVLWLFISNATIIYATSRLGQQTSTASTFQSGTPSGIEIWLISTIGQLSAAGFFSGLAMIVLGYAKLFLAKQAVFEQHVQEQLIIRAGGNVDATQLGKGANYMGDRTNVGGDVIGSSVGRGARVDARDITIFKQTVDNSTGLDAELKEKLTKAREQLEKLDVPQEEKDDVADDLGKITTELEKSEPVASRVKRFFKHIEEIAPSVAAILASATRIIQLLGISI